MNGRAKSAPVKNDHAMCAPAKIAHATVARLKCGLKAHQM